VEGEAVEQLGLALFGGLVQAAIEVSSSQHVCGRSCHTLPMWSSIRVETQRAGHLTGGCGELPSRDPKFLRTVVAVGPLDRLEADRSMRLKVSMRILMEWLLLGSGR
jgi:hypothetical protein